MIMEAPIIIAIGLIGLFRSIEKIQHLSFEKIKKYKQKQKYNKTSPICAYATKFEQYDCVVCLDGFHNSNMKLRKLPCEHVFHKSCIDEWIFNNSGKCPICNYTVLN